MNFNFFKLFDGVIGWIWSFVSVINVIFYRVKKFFLKVCIFCRSFIQCYYFKGFWKFYVNLIDWEFEIIFYKKYFLRWVNMYVLSVLGNGI